MAFCDKEKQLIDSGYTVVDNRFVINYLPDAPEKFAAVYLLGLTLADSNDSDNSCEMIAQRLNVSTEDVMSAYLYWEELGLVQIVHDTPTRVIYLPVRDSASALKKISPDKYRKFSRDIQDVIKGRMITVHEYNEYYMFLERHVFEPAALVAVAKYCAELKGNDINYSYILTVAQNQRIHGATTLAAVSERLNGQQKYDEDLKLVFKAMGSNKHFDHADRENYEKWTKDFGFTCDVIVAIAKNCKTGKMQKLDALLTEYYKKGALSVKEIESYESEKTRLYDLARAINKAIGVYYQSLDSVVDEYVVRWLRMGYADETLLAVAKYCFRSGIRTLNGLASVIDKLYKNGVTTLSSLEGYLATLADTDDKIQAILTKCGLDRRTTANDRVLYRTWTESWAMPQELIEYVAELSAGTNSPVAYVNRVLSDFKQQGVFTVEQAQAHKSAFAKTAATTATATIAGKDMERRKYTDEEISALFTALDDTED